MCSVCGYKMDTDRKCRIIVSYVLGIINILKEKTNTYQMDSSVA